MLMIIALEHLRRQFLPRDTTPKPMRRTAISSHREDLPPAQISIGTPAGTRYQLLRTLRAMAGGELMVVEYRNPQLSRQYLEDDDKRAEWFRSLRCTESWTNQSRIFPVLVPGTAYPDVIGRIMIRTGWSAPVDQPHWVPNLRFFYLTEMGFESLRKAQTAWQELTVLERIRLMLIE